MKYYLIYLKNGIVIDVCSFDDVDSQEHQYRVDSARIDNQGSFCDYDDIQSFREIR